MTFAMPRALWVMHRTAFRCLALTAWAALLLAGGAQAADRGAARELPYKDLARIALMLEKVDSDHVFSGKFSITSAAQGAPLPSDLRVEVRVGGAAVPVRVDPDGRMHLPIRQDWVDAGARLFFNQPKGRLVVRYDFRARVPPGTRMRYAQLAESAAVMARGIKAEAGLLSFAAPKPRALDVRFRPGPAQSITLRFADGTSKRWRAVDKGGYNAVELPWKPAWADAQVELSAPLGGIMPLVE